ncbi:MAG: MGMT family protein, partial [Gammaproteobacteria bacterium]|nr:MGMT family protein [Gammaproteobacteria bacterium]
TFIIYSYLVVGSDGSLTGFGGGLETKRRLLDLELTTLVK